MKPLAFLLPIRAVTLIARLVPCKKYRYYLHCIVATRRNFRQQNWHFTKKNRKPVLVASFGVDCLGITDRIKAMCSVWKFCKENGYEFRIAQHVPFELTDFFVPHKTDWRLDSSVEGFHVQSTVSCNGITGKEWFSVQQYAIGKFARMCPSDHLFIHGNTSFGNPDIKNLFNELFVMSPGLDKLVDETKSKLGDNYISASFRFVNTLGDSNEDVAGYDTLSPAEQIRLMERCVEETLKVQDGQTVLVTSDSSKFLKFSERIPNSYHLPSEGIHHHEGFSDEVSETQMMKSFAEFMLIQSARKAYQIQIGPMHESNFPKHSATIGGVEYKLIQVSLP